MPYKKTYKKRNYKKKPMVSKSVKKFVNTKINKKLDLALEDKHIDLNGILTVGWNGPAANLIRLTNIPVGTGDGQRIGDAVTLKNIMIKYAAVASATLEHMRVIIFQWSSYQYPIAGVNVLSVFNQPYTPESMYRYDDKHGRLLKILYDKRHVVSPNGDGTVIGGALLKKYLKHKIQYQPGTTQEMQDSIWLYVVSSQDNTVFPLPAYIYSIRVTYEDA